MMFPEIEETGRDTQRGEAAAASRESQPFGAKKAALAAVLAHELRNPLAAICAALQVLRQCGADAAQREWVQGVLERQTQQMGSLIEELLEFARLSHGKAQLQTRPVELAAVVARALETVRPGIDGRGHVLHVALPPAPVTLEADATLLAQVLTNLLGNAAKYTEPGGRIALTALVEGADVVVRVRDSGIGIAAEALPHVFDDYWQSSRAAVHARGGLGLGLALVREIVALHGGSVHAFSDGPGQGSEFVVRLPRKPRPDTQDGTVCAVISLRGNA